MIHILALDDNLDFHEILKAKLSSSKFTLSLASNEKEFFEKLDSSHQDIYLIDLSLDDSPLRGLEILAKIRHEKSNLVPVIVLSSSDSKKIISNALEMGANDFITKPVDGRLLVSKIEAVVSGNQAYAKKLKLGKLPSNQSNIILTTKLVLKAITEIGFLVEGNAFVAKGSKIKLSSKRIKEIFDTDFVEAYSTGFTSEEGGAYLTSLEINPENKELINKAKLWIKQNQSGN